MGVLTFHYVFSKTGWVVRHAIQPIGHSADLFSQKPLGTAKKIVNQLYQYIQEYVSNVQLRN